ncbi:uncharacterized protein ACWYII_030777 isoform 1-T1 [Salvelinus alpinus]
MFYNSGPGSHSQSRALVQASRESHSPPAPQSPGKQQNQSQVRIQVDALTISVGDWVKLRVQSSPRLATTLLGGRRGGKRMVPTDEEGQRRNGEDHKQWAQTKRPERKMKKKALANEQKKETSFHTHTQVL